MIAIDSSVLIDLLGDDPRAEAAEDCLRQALARGPVAVRAGEMQRRYKERRKAAGLSATGPRTVPDFLIGAHALLQCTALITRDAGFFRDYFKGLKLIVPQA